MEVEGLSGEWGYGCSGFWGGLGGVLVVPSDIIQPVCGLSASLRAARIPLTY
jgi:hypothetical protein